MGGGIAYVTAFKAGLPVRIKDINPQGINHALKYRSAGGKVRRRHLKAKERDRQLALISERRTIAALPIAIRLLKGV